MLRSESAVIIYRFISLLGQQQANGQQRSSYSMESFRVFCRAVPLVSLAMEM